MHQIKQQVNKAFNYRRITLCKNMLNEYNDVPSNFANKIYRRRG